MLEYLALSLGNNYNTMFGSLLRKEKIKVKKNYFLIFDFNIENKKKK